MPIPYRRCFYIDDRGQQCEEWFAAIDANKLCLAHRELITPNGRVSEDNKVKYIDLVNDERAYCYHFIDGSKQEQKQTLIFEYQDDSEGSVFEKIDAHIAFIEKVLEDMKARLHSARAVRSEKLDSLSEEERKTLRATRIHKELTKNPEKKTPSFKSDPIAFLSKKQNMSKEDASDLLSMDADALIAKFEAAKKEKEENKGE